MEIVWDSIKAAGNLRKHSVSFEVAVTVFEHYLAETYIVPQESSDSFITVGYSALQNLLLVVWRENAEGSHQIICARKATEGERAAYEERI